MKNRLTAVKQTEVNNSVEVETVVGTEYFPFKDLETLGNEVKDLLNYFYGRKDKPEDYSATINGTNPDGLVFSIFETTDGELMVDLGYDTENEGEVSDVIGGGGVEPYESDALTEVNVNAQANHILALAGYSNSDFFNDEYPILTEAAAKKEIFKYMKAAYEGEDSANEPFIARLDETTYFKISYSDNSGGFNWDTGGKPAVDEYNELADQLDGGLVDMVDGNSDSVIKGQVEYIMELIGY